MSRALFIPPLGFQLQLAEDWTFRIFDEHRNSDLLKASGLASKHPRVKHDDFWQMSVADKEKAWDASPWRVEGDDYNRYFHHNSYTFVTLRAGTLLKVERIFIRQGMKGFDSVTFRATEWVTHPGDPLEKTPKSKKSLRFWVKLDDANKIVFKEAAK